MEQGGFSVKRGERTVSQQSLGLNFPSISCAWRPFGIDLPRTQTLPSVSISSSTQTLSLRRTMFSPRLAV